MDDENTKYFRRSPLIYIWDEADDSQADDDYGADDDDDDDDDNIDDDRRQPWYRWRQRRQWQRRL